MLPLPLGRHSKFENVEVKIYLQFLQSNAKYSINESLDCFECLCRKIVRKYWGVASVEPPGANNESSEVDDFLLPVTFNFNPSNMLDNVKNFWRFVISPSVVSKMRNLKKSWQPKNTWVSVLWHFENFSQLNFCANFLTFFDNFWQFLIGLFLIGFLNIFK